MNIKTTFAAAAAAILMGTSAFAITADAQFSDSGTLAAGGTLNFNFTAEEDLTINDFIILNGTGAAANLELVTVRIQGVPIVNQTIDFAGNVTDFGASAAATVTASGFDLLDGESFRLSFRSTGGDDVVTTGFTFFTASTVSAVPLPAGGLLLLGGLGALGVARKRKAAKKA